MADFQFLHNPLSRTWVISAPRRATRPDEAKKHLRTCPFCPGGEADKQEVYIIDTARENLVDGPVRVVYNKFPFAQIHEVVIHSSDHLKSFTELPLNHVSAVFQAFQHRYNEHARRGQVVIFHNHGIEAGESLPHPHTQIAVIPEKIHIDAPELRSVLPQEKKYREETDGFLLLTPIVSQFPDEVWIVPKTKGKTFGQITEKECVELSYLVKQLVLIFDHRYNRDFPFNFYIYPGENWYFRLIPRVKSIGGFELATGIFVNTQKPEETMEFIKEHLHKPNLEKILKDQQAGYEKSV